MFIILTRHAKDFFSILVTKVSFKSDLIIMYSVFRFINCDMFEFISQNSDDKLP